MNEDQREELEMQGMGSMTADLEFDMSKSGNELDSYIDDIAETVRIGLDQSIAILTPWFFNNMPRIYYATTPRAEKVRHLSAVITGHVFETKQTVELWDRNRAKVTYIGPGGDRNILIDMASRLPKKMDLKMGSVYFSRDNLLFLSTFFTKGFKGLESDNKLIVDKISVARGLIKEDFPSISDDELEAYLSNLDNDFVVYATASRLQITYRMYRHMLLHEGAHTIMEPYDNSPTARLSIGFRGMGIQDVLEPVLHLVSQFQFDIVRVFAVRFNKGLDEPITVMHFVINQASNEKVTLDSIATKKLTKAIRTLGWVDRDEYGELTHTMGLSIGAVNYIRSMSSWVHVLLGKDNPYYYSEYKILRTFKKYQDLALELIEVFRLRFDPLREKERQNDGYQKAYDILNDKISEVIDPVERTILKSCLKFTGCILKTNYFLPTKTGLAFRLSSDVLDPKYYPNKPFGIFFVTGRDYRFFQIRWKDIARGGLRVVMPRSNSDYSFAFAGVFDEVYGLSYAQQLKNKDIPEGGSKAVLLLKPGGEKSRAVKGAINALLDLLVSEDEIHEEDASNQVSYYKDEEIIYLGPDENMTNDLIEWVPVHAAKRGYKYAQAFMSSKPKAGINHKEYGVTSEGLNVFLDHALRFMGINPKKDSFTIKMTGGPDGDVAGNELKILHREYGENAKVVAIADGFGAAYDPEGLDWGELLRLAEEGLSIAEFNAAKISKAEGSYLVHADTAENIKTRNELHAVTEADVFIPAGGRPYTVNEKNWHRFLKDGKLTCRVIVEGANIFFTTEARENLQKEGMIVIKDSSANKTGVICSSYEIIASLLLSEDEFTEIKDQYVSQVIEILREKAGNEAKLLLHMYDLLGQKESLVSLSMEISQEINQVTDMLLSVLTKDKENVLKDPMFRSIIEKHCPAILREKYGDRIHTDLPDAHKIAIISATVASYIIYREGLRWLQTINTDDQYKAVITYIQQDKLTEDLVSNVQESSIANKDKIIDILRMSAAKDLTLLNLKEKFNGNGKK